LSLSETEACRPHPSRAADALAAVDSEEIRPETLPKCGIGRLVNCRRPVQTRILPLEYQCVPVVYDESGRGEAAYKIEGGISMSNEKSLTSKTATRRRFMLAAGAGAAAVAAPSVVSAQGPISMRWQSTWPSKDIFHEYALDYAKKVNDMTGGDLKIDVLPAGAVVPAFQLLDAVSKGTLDGGHGVLVYHYGKQTALALWGSGPGYAMDANMLLAWHKYGGGKELLDKLYASIGGNVVSFPYGPMPTQPFGWFKKPVTKLDDVKGLKFRTVGISIDVYSGMGAAVNALPGGEIVAAMDRGLLDAAEFNNATSDRILGFADVSKVCMLQSYHQNAEQFEIMFNKDKYNALPEKMRAIIANAVEAASADMSWKAIDRYSKDYVELQTKDNVKFYKTPDAILKRQLEIFDEVAKKKAAENPLFKEIVESQLAFAKRATQWEQDTVVSRKMVFDHYWAPNAKKPI
jgi:TRAP-type mannitol/chloroaromatic compound transport system substrate-binding protein